MSTTKLKTASVLAFERKLANSDAFMYAGNWSGNNQTSDWQPISVREKAVRGVISNRLKNAITSDDAKLDAEIQKANLQRVDVAALPVNQDTLKVSFSLRVLGNLATPSVCNKPQYQQKLMAIIEAYIQQHQFTELASRYAENIANGRFLWRNRVGAEAIEVHVREKVDQQTKQAWQFNAHDFDLRAFSSGKGEVSGLANIIQQGLTGDRFALLEIDAYVRLGQAQEVFPSQELVLDVDKGKSKYLYHINDIAGMHSQKIGNALRTIDTWYPEQSEQGLGPIAVEPYGSVTSRGKAYRQPSAKADFYTLLDRWVLNEQPSIEQQHYVIATLIRGGVFGAGGEKG